MRKVEGEGTCGEGIEMAISPDQFACMPACSWNTWVCGIRVRTEVIGLDPPQSVGCVYDQLLKIYMYGY